MFVTRWLEGCYHSHNLYTVYLVWKDTSITWHQFKIKLFSSLKEQLSYFITLFTYFFFTNYTVGSCTIYNIFDIIALFLIIVEECESECECSCEMVVCLCDVWAYVYV